MTCRNSDRFGGGCSSQPFLVCRLICHSFSPCGIKIQTSDDEEKQHVRPHIWPEVLHQLEKKILQLSSPSLKHQTAFELCLKYQQLLFLYPSAEAAACGRIAAPCSLSTSFPATAHWHGLRQQHDDGAETQAIYSQYRIKYSIHIPRGPGGRLLISNCSAFRGECGSVTLGPNTT